MAGLALTLLLLARYAEGWPTDNRVTTWLRQGIESERYQTLIDRFGGDETVLVRVDDFATDNADDMTWLDALGPRLAALPALSHCLDPLHLPSGRGLTPAGVLTQASARPLAQALDLVDLDAPRVDFLLVVDSAADPTERAELAHLLTSLGAESESQGMRLRAAGHTLLAVALDEEALRVERVFSPLLAIAALIATWIALRSFGQAVVVVLPAALASLGVRSALRFVDWPSSMVLVSCGPLVFVLLVASVLHLVSAFRQAWAAGSDQGTAARTALSETWQAGLLAAATTSIGFGVFGLSSVTTVSRLGIAVALAVAVSVPAAFVLATHLLARLPLARPPTHLRQGRFWRRVAVAAIRRRRLVQLLAVAVLVTGAVAPFDWERGTNALDYFPVTHPVRQQFTDIEAEGGALSAAELIIVRPHADRSLDWLAGAHIAEKLAGVQGVHSVFGPEHVLADLNHVAGLFAAPLAPEALVAAGRSDTEGTHTRWTVRFITAGADAMDNISQGLLGAINDWCTGEGAQAYLTGALPGVLGVQHELIDTLALSLLLTVAATALLFAWVATSRRELGAAVMTNMVPVMATLILARVVGIPLDASSAMVGAAVLGLAVDNTFHLLHTARVQRHRGPAAARLAASQRVGEAAAVSSCALAAGFGLLAASGFAPTARFGLLVAAGVCVALVADVALLPALWWPQRGVAGRPTPRQ